MKNQIEEEPSVTRITFLFMEMLADITGVESDNWEELGGPDSGCGLDYWFGSKDGTLEAYINVDQTYVSVSVNNTVTGEEECAAADYEEDEWIRQFIKTSRRVISKEHQQ